MAWPFSNVVAPTFNTLLVAVPTGALTSIDSTNPIWLLGAIFANTNNTLVTVRVTDGTSKDIIPTMEVPPNMILQIPFDFPPCNGLQWLSSGTGLNGQLWGYK